jgi:cytochrome c oxidase subunit IV
MKAHHVISPVTYLIVYVVLLVLLGLTVAVTYLHLGPLGTLIGLSIAVVKALVIILYFMHARYSSRLTQIFAAAAFAGLAIMIGLTLNDYISRNWLAPPGI